MGQKRLKEGFGGEMMELLDRIALLLLVALPAFYLGYLIGLAKGDH